MNYSFSQIWKISAPVLFSLLMQHIIGMTDTAFLGRVGEVELGAAALGSVFYLAFFMIGFGFSTGTQILVARRHGEERTAEIGGIVTTSMISVLVLGVAMTVAARWGGAPILKPFLASEQVYRATVEYLNWRVFGLSFVFAGVVFRAFFVGVTQTRVLAINSVILVACNVLLDYVLVFGKWGFPQMGIAGAALASVISEAVSALFYLIYCAGWLNWRQYGVRWKTLYGNAVFKQVFSLSFWTMLQMFIAIAVWMFFFIAVEHLGERPLAIVNLVRSLSSIAFILINAFAVTASSLVSNLIGAGNADNVGPLTWRITGMAAIPVLGFLAVVVVFPQYVLWIYTDNQELMRDTVTTVWVMAGAHLLQLPANIWHSVVSGTGNTRTALWIELAALFAYAAAVWYIAVVLAGSTAMCWTTEILYQAVILAGSWTYMRFGRWREKKL